MSADATSEMPTREPFLVEPGWTDSVVIPNVNGPTYRLLFYPHAVRFQHRCDRGDRGVVIAAPALAPAHRVQRDPRPRNHDNVTVEPSILCSDCGTHGFVRNGRWVQA